MRVSPFQTALCTPLVAILLLSLAVGAEETNGAPPQNPSADDLAFFEKEVRPLLVKRCYECHSSQAKIVKGGLLLDSRDGWMKGGDSGPAVVPGSPNESTLLAAVRYESYEMPPTGKLADAEVAIFEKWIARGAPDPRVAKEVLEAKPVDPELARSHWSLLPIAEPPVPAVNNATWPKTDVDRFILSKLEAKGLSPAGDADRLTLLRRVSFDLTGLPPTLEEIEAFTNDARPEAFAAVVDRLLADPGFGERWGRRWLDIARYADSNGLDENFTFYDAWRYRNYVIQAFANDKPFDRFITEQLAGDLLPHATQEERDENVTATGFLVVGPKVIGAFDKPQLHMDVVDEQLDTIGKAFLGLTVGCARCHDHKFDPIPTKDYYALAGIFTSTRTIHGRLLNRKDLSGWNLHALGTGGKETYEKFLAHSQTVADLESEQKKMKRRHDALSRGVVEQAGAAMADEASTETPLDPKEELKQLLEKLPALEKQIAELKAKAPPRPPVAMSVDDVEQPGPTEICIRGDAHRRGEAVERGFLSVVAGKKESIGEKSSGRLELARWLTDSQNPLTSRVAVNRVWGAVFGEGLVRTVDNFGVQGEPPSHPELLDHLALEFMREGWSVKKLIRELVLSRTYQMSSVPSEAANIVDPENRLLARMNRRRLEAEPLRDGLLAIAGVLDRSPGESSVAHLAIQATGVGVKPNPPFESNRRTVYLPVVRNDLPPLFHAFDFADPQMTTGRRNRTTVPSQALLLMNSPLVADAASKTAKRLLEAKTVSTDRDRLARAWLLIFNRPLTEEEAAPALKLLEDARTDLAASGAGEMNERAWNLLCHSLFCSTRFLFVD